MEIFLNGAVISCFISQLASGIPLNEGQAKQTQNYILPIA